MTVNSSGLPLDPRQSVQAGLDHLASRLDPIIAAKLGPVLKGLPWTAILVELDRSKGHLPKTYAKTDLQSQLRMLTERLGRLGYPFDNHQRAVSTLGNELRIVRNAWAHNDPLSALDAWRAQDFVVRLLEQLSDPAGLTKAIELHAAALRAVVDAEGTQPAGPANVSAPTPSTSEPETPDSELVEPPEEVRTRNDPTATPTIGEARDDFEAWTPVLVGDISVLDDLPKKAAKERVRAVAVEITDFEGPIHIDRLAHLIAASFDVQKLHANRHDKIVRQVKAAGLSIDSAKFVWPASIDPSTWREFRPNTSAALRAFDHISPVEIANAMRFISEKSPGLRDAELDAATLATFGRKRRTKPVAAHLDVAKQLIV